ncbi:MAG: helix-turn-helix domain-containing protein [Ruminococcaceae bacterium]|nr:helix-turn-helix domain-containing protein [Oscillospiraceae bacterium]
MKTVYEGSNIQGSAHVSCIKYRNLQNISHYHSDYELVYVNEGIAQVAVNDKKYELHTDEGIFIHSNDIHNINSDRRTVITVLKAEKGHFDSLFASKRLQSTIIDKSLNAKTVLAEVKTELTSDLENRDALSESLVSVFFIKLLRLVGTVSTDSRTSEKHTNNELYNKISRMLSDEYSTITFEIAASRLHFSQSYFSKLFRSLFGMTFTQYLNTVRIAAAIEKLEKGESTVAEISHSCGFNTIRNFNRVFRSFTGYAPSNLPSDYEFLYNLKSGCGLDPTLNCTEILE